MNPNDINNQSNQGVPQQQQVPVTPVQPVYTESKASKIVRQTGTVMAGVGMLTGLVAMIKGIFKK